MAIIKFGHNAWPIIYAHELYAVKWLLIVPLILVESDNNTVESGNNTDSNEDENSIAIFTWKIKAKEVYYSTVLIEYPKTSELDIVTVYNITGWNNPRDCWKNVSIPLMVL